MNHAPAKERDKLWVSCAWLLLYFVLALFGRVQAQSDQDDFGRFEDEPAHMVTSAMMRSYVTGPAPLHPLRYVEDYYLHYPKVASGQWPPALHLGLGAVMVPLGVTRLALLIATCLVAAFAAWAVRLLARSSLPTPLPGLLGLVFLSLPMVQEFSGAPMTELLVAAFGALAVHHYGHYLRTGKTRRALLFGGFTICAVLTKGNALGLILVPILAPILTGRWRRMCTLGTVIAGVSVGIVGFAWYSQTMDFSQSTWAGRDQSFLLYASLAAEFYSTEVVLILGSLATALACLGLVLGMVDPKTRDQTASYLSWILGLGCCILFLRTGIEARHEAAILPILIVLTGRGALWLWRFLGWGPATRGLPAAALILIGLGLQAYAPVQSNHHGFQDAVDIVASSGKLEAAPWLVVSDPTGEGLLVAEAVLRDPRHERLQVLRASKVLANDNWLGRGYSLKYQTEEEIDAFLTKVPVSVIFFDFSTWRKHWYPHHDLLLSFLENNPDRFQEIARIDTVRNGLYCPGAMRIYRHVGYEDLPVHPLQLEDVLKHP